VGLDDDIRELYSFLCQNYADGDEIILTGFSRGAFTARSVADLVASVGLLTLAGYDHFYNIFEDYENMGNIHRSADEYLCGTLKPYNNEKGKARILWEEGRMKQYVSWLKEVSISLPLQSAAV